MALWGELDVEVQIYGCENRIVGFGVGSVSVCLSVLSSLTEPLGTVGAEFH